MFKHILVFLWRTVHTTCTLLVAAFVLPVTGGYEQLFFAIVETWWVLLIIASLYAMTRLLYDMR